MRSKARHNFTQSGATGRPGFTVVELLVAVALMAMLMAAVALAMQGAADATEYGADKSGSLASATLALNRLSTDLRQATDVTQPTAHSMVITLPDGTTRTYSWNGVAKAPLMLVTPGHPGGNVLVPQVVRFDIATVRQFSAIANANVAVSVQATLEARHGDTTTPLTTYVRLRRNIL